jgi:predicted O-methyltransferase YrrM
LPDSPDRSFDETLALAQGVAGWMTDDQARRLWDRATELGSGAVVVEIGSFRGKSTVVLATALGPDADLVAIDPHGGTDRGPQEWTGREVEAAEDFDVFHENLQRADVVDRVRHVRKFSDDALGDVTGPVDLLYIDGAHRWGPAARDIRHWGGRLPIGAVLLIHDSFSSIGVTAAQASELFLGGRFRYEGRSQSMSQYRREDLPMGVRLRNCIRQLAELPWFGRNVAIKVLISLGMARLTRYLGHRSADWPY